MAKKVRETSSTYRPGGQGPSRTSKTQATSAAAEPAPSEPVDGVAVLSAQAAGTAVVETTTSKPSARRSRRGVRARADSLDVRAAAEDVYVRQDLRNIAAITAGLFIALIVAWVLLVPLNIVGIY